MLMLQPTKVRHLCPSNVALLWAAWAVCPVGRPSNAGCNQLHLHACLATNRNREGRLIACPTHNAQGNHECLPAVMHGPQAGVRPPNAQASWPWPGVGPAVLLPHARYTSPSYLSRSALSTSMGNQPIQRWSMRGQSLGHVGHSPHGYCAFTGLTKPWPIVQSCAAGLGRRSLCGSSGCNGHRVSCRANHSPARTMYMDGHPMAAWPIQAGQLHAHKRSAAD